MPVDQLIRQDPPTKHKARTKMWLRMLELKIERSVRKTAKSEDSE